MLYVKSINLWRRWGGGVYFLEVVPSMQISISFQKYLSQRKIIFFLILNFTFFFFKYIYFFLILLKCHIKRVKYINAKVTVFHT